MPVSRTQLLEWIKPEAFTAAELEYIKLLKPGDYEIYSEKLSTIVDEAAEVFVKTGVTSMLHSGDLVVGIYSPAGDMIVASCGTYLHAVTAQLPIKYVLGAFQEEPTVGIKEGDIFYCNDGLYGGIHNPDQIAFMPIFFEGTLIAWSCAAVHQAETGAVEPGGMPLSAKSRHYEGMKLSPIKIGENYQIRADLMEMMENMISRAPRMQVIDVRARVTAANRIRIRIQEFVAAIEPAVLWGLFRQMLLNSEQGARKRISDWPDGKFSAVSFSDTLGTVESLVRTKLTIIKQGDHLTFDFSGTSPENEGPVNAFAHITAAHTAIYLYAYAFHDLPITSGTFAPLDFIIPQGSLLNAGSEAAISQSVYACWQLTTLTPIVFSKMMYGSKQRELVTSAAGNNHTVPFVYAGINQWGVKIADLLGYPFNAEGGGARSDMDGVDCYGFPYAHYGRGPDVEDVENETMFLHLFQNELIDSGGPGKYRGGTAVQTMLLLHHTPRAFINTMGVTSRITVGQGLFGGYPPPIVPGVQISGSDVVELFQAEKAVPRDIIELARDKVIHGDYRFERTARPSRLLMKGDLISAIGSGGGGYGDALERDPLLVMKDVKQKRISYQAARDIYKVALDPDTGHCDLEETQKMRQAERKDRLTRGKPYAEFIKEWSLLKPPDEMLINYGTWPDAKANRPIIRI
ncbi:hydantoinase B/oxoprolinase family protein [candidate division CSSED10-310 bacterium]|uniref:Hydantoinase B/oxoprolinase family protein n=1 Tax=candidate division CSSED10-310 bacterium TaxID=2855610 RepID=A0ABV6YSS4_UNCC1